LNTTRRAVSQRKLAEQNSENFPAMDGFPQKMQKWRTFWDKIDTSHIPFNRILVNVPL